MIDEENIGYEKMADPKVGKSPVSHCEVILKTDYNGKVDND